MLDVPIYEPDFLISGDTATWRRRLDRYPASDGWVISYALVQQKTGLQITITGTADGDEHLVNVPAATTEAWPAGDYVGAGFCSKGTDRFTIWRGTINVSPDLAGPEPGDPRTPARKTLDAIEAVIAGRASQEVLEFTVEGTVLRKAAVADLLLLRDRYVVIVRKEEMAERVATGRPTGRRILTRFSRAY